MDYQVIVIGSGPGGYVCAIRAAQLGFKVACIEVQPKLGGTCLNVGCIPSKALLESSHHYHRAMHEFAEHGIACKGVSLDLKTLLGRKDGIVEGITGGVEFLFKKNKIEWIQGHGAVNADSSVTVTKGDGSKQQLKADHVVLAMGSVPIELPFARFDHEHVVDSTDALSFDKVPGQLLVVGGGVIGLELGSVWQRLGAKVTVIEALDHILGNADAGMASAMLTILKKQGLDIQLSAMLTRAEVKGKKVQVAYTVGGKEQTLSVDKVLIAVGRRPMNKGLKEVGVQLTKSGFVEVDAHYRTNLPGVYAIGDLIPGPMLAHKAEDEGIALAEMLAGKAGHVNYEAMPSVVYTWPELASFGLSEEDCKAKGLAYKTGRFNFKPNGRAKAMGEGDGFVKIIADAETDRVLGAHILGPMASELIGELVVAAEFGASAEDIARTVHAHPTLAEVVKEAALAVDKRALHS